MVSRRFLVRFVEDSGVEREKSFSLRKLLDENTASSNIGRIHMTVKYIIRRKHNKDSVFADPVLNWFEKFLAVLCPTGKRQVLN